MTESLERRAEELMRLLQNGPWETPREKECRQVIEQLLSENRQVRGLNEKAQDMVMKASAEAAGLRLKLGALNQDLDRISAEREAYRTFIEEVKDWDDSMDVLEARARRILAENDR